jgi:hypothetical protein
MRKVEMEGAVELFSLGVWGNNEKKKYSVSQPRFELDTTPNSSQKLCRLSHVPGLFQF